MQPLSIIYHGQGLRLVGAPGFQCLLKGDEGPKERSVLLIIASSNIINQGLKFDTTPPKPPSVLLLTLISSILSPFFKLTVSDSFQDDTIYMHVILSPVSKSDSVLPKPESKCIRYHRLSGGDRKETSKYSVSQSYSMGACWFSSNGRQYSNFVRAWRSLYSSIIYAIGRKTITQGYIQSKDNIISC